MCMQVTDQPEGYRYVLQPTQPILQGSNVVKNLPCISHRCLVGLVDRLSLKEKELLKVCNGPLNATGEYCFTAQERVDQEMRIGQHLPDARQLTHGAVGVRQLLCDDAIIEGGF